MEGYVAPLTLSLLLVIAGLAAIAMGTIRLRRRRRRNLARLVAGRR
jgi:hypothetical protein